MKRDRLGNFLAAWPGYDGWPVKVTLLSQPFQLSAGCPSLSFSGHSDNANDSVELQLLGESGAARDLGRYTVPTQWRTIALPAAPTLTGQRVQLQVTLFATAELNLRHLGAQACS